MITIRKGSFETNSSSTHAIVIPKKSENEYYLYDSLDHNYGFGREECRLIEHWDEKLAYIYIVLKDFKEWNDDDRKIKITQDDIDAFKQNVCKIFEDVLKEQKYDKNFSPNPKDVFDYIDRDGNDGDLTGDDSFVVIAERYGNFVDHCEDYDKNGFLEKVLHNNDYLKKYLFDHNSYITIGGDEYRGYNLKTIGFEHDYDDYYYVNKDGERPPKEWYNKDGKLKSEYWDEYDKEYNILAGEFWDKLKDYKKDNDVFLKGN